LVQDIADDEINELADLVSRLKLDRSNRKRAATKVMLTEEEELAKLEAEFQEVVHKKKAKASSDTPYPLSSESEESESSSGEDSHQFGDTSDEEELEQAFQSALGRSFRDKAPTKVIKSTSRITSTALVTKPTGVIHQVGGSAIEPPLFSIDCTITNPPIVYDNMLTDDACLDLFEENGVARHDFDAIIETWYTYLYVA
jgi:hypothetical protein